MHGIAAFLRLHGRGFLEGPVAAAVDEVAGFPGRVVYPGDRTEGGSDGGSGVGGGNQNGRPDGSDSDGDGDGDGDGGGSDGGADSAPDNLQYLFEKTFDIVVNGGSARAFDPASRAVLGFLRRRINAAWPGRDQFATVRPLFFFCYIIICARSRSSIASVWEGHGLGE